MRSLVYFSAAVGLFGFATADRVLGQSEKNQKKPTLSVANGDFERSYGVENPWNGVDSKGKLDSFRAALPVLTENGTIGKTPMPVSVAIHDMNGDGLPDLVTADPKAYIRVYFNEGTKTEPKFLVGELAQAFVGVPVPDVRGDETRLGPRISVIEGGGAPQLLVGNYFGEIFVLPNSGSAQKPDFRQPRDISKLAIPTMEKAGDRWGNVFAPKMWDWNNDGKFDLIIGEGSYSANNIHLAINEGTNGSPTFSQTNRHVIAFGDGREQLTPAVVDYNGDGRPDLLVAARDGKVGVYLQGDEPWKPGVELPFSSFLSVGGKPLSVRGIATVTAGDLNGDELFDVVVGQADGAVSYALNAGTKQEPKFSALTDFAGATPFPQMKWPSGWDLALGIDRGNNLVFASVVEEDPAEGKSCLKIGYVPNFNQIMPSPINELPARTNFKLDDKTSSRYSATELMDEAASNLIMVRQRTASRFAIGETYTLSFKVKGNGISNAEAVVSYEQFKQTGEDKITRGDRGRAKVKRARLFERKREKKSFSAGSNWSEIKASVTPRFDERELNEAGPTNAVDLEFVFEMEPGTGVLYIDDVKLTKN
ncbi:MAG: VCBS repeat-containing protein [Chthoniobacterales bacterium]